MRPATVTSGAEGLLPPRHLFRQAPRLPLLLGLLPGLLPGLPALCLLGCEPPIALPEPTPPRQDPTTDRLGPALETTPITAPQPADQPIRFEALAEDSSGVFLVTLHYKPLNTDWQAVRMLELEDDPGRFSVLLTPDLFPGASSISYYLEAADATPYRNTSLSPSSGKETPYRFNLSVAF